MLIGICGRRFSGKSTIANYAKLKYGFRVVSPIDPVKQLACDVLGFTHEQMWGASKSRDEAHPTLLRANGEPLTGRGFLDDVGAVIVDCCPSAMAAHCMGVTLKLAAEGHDVINESLRRLTEMQAMKDAGAKLIRRRGGLAPKHRIDAEVDALPDSFFDAVLEQYPTKEQLYAHLDVLVDGWKSEAGQ